MARTTSSQSEPQIQGVTFTTGESGNQAKKREMGLIAYINWCVMSAHCRNLSTSNKRQHKFAHFIKTSSSHTLCPRSWLTSLNLTLPVPSRKMSSSHGHNLRPNVDSRVNKRVEDMVDAYGGPEHVTGKRSATGLGVHLIFRYESPKPSPNPRPRRFTHAPPEGDVEMVDSTESESGSSLGMDSSQSSSSSDADTVEPNPPCSAHCIPSLTLQTPKPRRPEDLHRGMVMSTDGSVTDTSHP